MHKEVNLKMLLLFMNTCLFPPEDVLMDTYKINVRQTIGHNSEDMKSITIRGQLPPGDTEETNVTWVDLPHQSTVQCIRKFILNFRTVSENIRQCCKVYRNSRTINVTSAVVRTQAKPMWPSWFACSAS